MNQHHDDDRLGRRDALKKAAVAGGLAWTAPMILSSKVAASVGTCPDCVSYYFVKWNWSNSYASWTDASCETTGTSNPAANCGNFPQGLPNAEQAQNGCLRDGVPAPGLSISGPQHWPTITIPSGGTIIGVSIKAGQSCPRSGDLSNQCLTHWTGNLGVTQDISNLSVFWCE